MPNRAIDGQGRHFRSFSLRCEAPARLTQTSEAILAAETAQKHPCPYLRSLPHTDRRGFTLLEIMVALAITGGLLVTLIYTLNYNLDLAVRNEYVTVATILARGKISEIETAPVTSEGKFPDPYSSYSYVTTVGESPFPGIAMLTVVVKRDKEEVKLAELIEVKK